MFYRAVVELTYTYDLGSYAARIEGLNPSSPTNIIRENFMSWITESNRDKHFLYAIPCGFILSLVFVLGLAIGMEFKDYKYGQGWDWLDLLATVLGGIVGQGLQIGLLMLI